MNIVIPKNMKDTISEHLSLTGRTLKMDPNSEMGTIEETGDTVIGLRSGDIPVTVEDHSDIGFCGSDWVEEVSLRHRVDLVDLAKFEYGRKTLKSPTLDLITKEEEQISGVEQIKPGSMILTEYPELTAKFLKEHGLNYAHLERNNGVPPEPEEFRKWCAEQGRVGIRTVHGGVAALVTIGMGYGVMVSEKGDTLRDYNLKILENIHIVRTLLVADRDRLIQPEGKIILDLVRELGEAYPRLLEKQARGKSPESTVHSFLGKER